MGASVTTARTNQAAAKASLAKMCEAISEAVLEVAKTGGPLNEQLVAMAAADVAKLAEQQAGKSAAELTRIIQTQRLKQALNLRGSQGSSGSNSNGSDGSNQFVEKLATDLLFLEMLRVALNQDSDDDSDSEKTEKPHREIAHPWTRKEMLGRGAFGAVYGAVDKNGFEFAVKEVPKDGVEEKSLREEVKVLGKLSHTNIVQFYGCAGDNQKIYMYMEIMQGSIKDIIDNSGKSIPQGQARKYTKDLVQGLVYLHQNGVVHNDIKCANVLLDYNGIAKLADMGVSKKHDQETLISYTDEQVGTIAWMSPEVCEGRDSGKRSDVWSMGCTVYEMLKGKPPFVDQLPAILVYTVLPQLIKALEHRKLVGRQEDFSIPIKRFLLRIFVRMEDRPLSENIAKDEWLQ